MIREAAICDGLIHAVRIEEAAICDGTVQMKGGPSTTIDAQESICSGMVELRGRVPGGSAAIAHVSDKEAAGFGAVATLASLNSKKNVTASGGNAHIKYVVVGMTPPKFRYATAALVLVALAGIAGAVALNFGALAGYAGRADRTIRDLADSLVPPTGAHAVAANSMPAHDSKTTETALNETAPRQPANRVPISWNCANCPSDLDSNAPRAGASIAKPAPSAPGIVTPVRIQSSPSAAAIQFRSRSAKENHEIAVEVPESSNAAAPAAVARPSPSWAPAHCSNCRND